MIKDILNSNEEILPNTKQIEVLKENFPACFNADGSFDIERFKEYLSDKLMVSNEGYELKFLGKNYARLLASIDTTTVIVPDEEHNNKPENKDSQNIYISGDNLDGLKQLLKSYAHQVKCIYIDPPYNTGSDGFVYNDNFNFSAEELSTKLSIDEEQAQRILDLTKRGSASHSAWLMFMYPRLLLARDLLTDDGVIFISIDDNECHNLKLLCDDVFGEENFIAEFPRITKRGGKSSDIIAKNHDYFLMYSKGVKPNLYAIEHNDAAFKYSDDFFGERGFYKLNQTLDYDSLQYSSSLDYPLEIEGETFYPGQSEQLYKERQNGNHDVADWAWRWSREKFKFGCENGFIVVKHGRNGKRIYTKTYQKATIEGNDSGYYIDYSDRTKALSTLETTENIYSNDNATKDVAKTIGKKIFDHTKPLELLMLIARLCTRKGDIILDFFSGSATTAEAIMKLNCNEQDEMRKFIMIQLPELCKEGTSAYKAGYRTICDIGMDRIIKSRELYNQEFPTNTADLGFKHYTLEEPNTTTLDKLENFVPEDQSMFLTNDILTDFGTNTVLTTWLDENGNRISNEEFTLNYIVDFTEADFAQKLVDQINGELPQTAIISEEKLNAVAKKIGKSSDDLFDELYNKRYIDRHLNIKPETRDLFFAEYPDFTAGLSAGKVKDRNKDKPKPVKIRKAVYNEIKELWETINHRYLLFYDNDLNNNLDDVVLKLFEKPGVFTDLVMRSDRDVVKSTGAEMNVIRETGVQYVIRKTIPYNVFLKRISSATNLPIKVLHTALTKYAQKHGTEFTAHINENTVAGFCAEFSAWKNDNLQGRFRYERSKAPLGATALTYADGTVRSEISQGRIGTKIVPGTPSGKYLYDSYAYDSPLEKDNIIADIDEVIVYGKIPRASIAIPTITGGMYSPDFMYVVKHKNGHKELNIIVETKDVENKTDLRGTEKAKIECAKVFFNMLTADGLSLIHI